MGKLDDILDNARYRVASNDVLKQEIRAFVLAETSQALNESQSLPEFVDKLTAKVKSW